MAFAEDRQFSSMMRKIGHGALDIKSVIEMNVKQRSRQNGTGWARTTGVKTPRMMLLH